MNLEQLPYFIAIASYGSLSAASRHLDVSQQALSSYLTELEKSVNMPLFFRSKQRLHLTDAGRRYLKTAQAITNVMERARNMIQLRGRVPAEELHIGISPHTGALLLGLGMLEFIQRYPNVQLIPHEGYSYELRRMIRDGTVQIGLTSLEAEQLPGLKSVAFTRDEFVLALPAYHPRAVRASSFSELPVADLADFRDEVFVRSTPNTTNYHAFLPLFEQAGFRPTVAMATPNINMLTTLIRKGCGIGFLRYTDDPTLSFYRLKNPPYTYNAVIAREDHEFTEPERYMIYLVNKHHFIKSSARINTELLQAINSEFSPGDLYPEDI